VPGVQAKEEGMEMTKQFRNAPVRLLVMSLAAFVVTGGALAQNQPSSVDGNVVD
jgi:hypothetical protein